MYLNPDTLDSVPNADLLRDVEDGRQRVIVIRAIALSLLGLLFMILVCGGLNDCRRQRARRRNARRRSASTDSITTIPDEIVDMPELRFPPAVDPVIAILSVSGDSAYAAYGISPSRIRRGDLDGRVETPPPPYVPPPGYEERHDERTGNLSV